MSAISTLTLDVLINKLNAIAPLSLAGSWDKVGLLVDPTNSHDAAGDSGNSSLPVVNSILITNDLTREVGEIQIK